MKIASPALATLLLAATFWSPAHAQGMPHGSYLQSCSNAAMEGDALVATCRSVHGREQRSMLAGVRRCVGDIGNNNGILQCSVGGGVARGQVVAGGAGPHPDHGPGYGPTPSYRGPPPGWERARWERCHEWHERAQDIRIRLEREYNPVERGRLEGRLHEMRERLERCR
jgi:hypothetical protein